MSLLDLGDVTVRIESAVLPPITIAPFSGGGEATGPSSPPMLEQLVKPKVTVLAPNGSVLYTVAPVGDPPSTPWVGLGAVGLFVGVLVGVFMLGRASR